MGSMLPYIAAPWIRHGYGFLHVFPGDFAGPVDLAPCPSNDEEMVDFMVV